MVKKKKAPKKMSKANKTKLATQGKKIMAEAKRIYKANPNKKWQDCVKQAAKKLKK